MTTGNVVIKKASATATADSLRGRDMLCFSHDWSGDPLSKTHLMRLMARENRVLWVNSINYRAPTASKADLSRAFWKLAAAASPLREVEPNIFTLNPLAIPAYGNPGVRLQPRVSALAGQTRDAPAQVQARHQLGLQSGGLGDCGRVGRRDGHLLLRGRVHGLHGRGLERARRIGTETDAALRFSDRIVRRTLSIQSAVQPAYGASPAWCRLCALPPRARRGDDRAGRDRAPTSSGDRFLRVDRRLGGCGTDGERGRAFFDRVGGGARQGDDRRLIA